MSLVCETCSRRDDICTDCLQMLTSWLDEVIETNDLELIEEVSWGIGAFVRMLRSG